MLNFDYIIVGAGSAGCVLANRLSSNPKTKVCLVEAGIKDTSPFIKIPLGLMALFDHPKLNWRFLSTPQKNANNRTIYIPRGKTLGGSSSINGMVYTRGEPDDYDEWARCGNRGWSYEEVLPYFKKSEHNENFSDSPHHGQNGEINVRFLDEYNPLTNVMLRAAEQLQYPLNEDFCGATHEGFGRRQVMQKNGLRVSSASAFLDPIKERKNLTVLTQATARKVTFSGKRATGLEAVIDGHTQLLTATREVVLSAGAVGSPHLLLLSGIGPSAHLAANNVAVVHDLQHVGLNLQDHFNAQLQFDSLTTMPYGVSLQALPGLIGHGFKYLFRRNGLISSNVVESGGFIKTVPTEPKPDIQLILVPALQSAVLRTNRRKGRRQKLWQYGHGFSIMSCLLRPESTGSIRLNNRDPHGDPLVDFNTFSDPHDQDLTKLVAGLRIGRRLVATKPFEGIVGDECRPGAGAQTDDELEVYVRNSASTNFHPAGTCKMGPDPEHAVVAPSLKVHGVQNLRVADASIMPQVIGGNTHSPTVMIAEKAADLIIGEAKHAN